MDKTTRGRGVSVIFGDGAGAVVLQASDEAGKGVLTTKLHSEGQHAKELALLGPSTSHWVDAIIEENNPIKRKEWAKNPQANRNQAALEGGLILDINGLNLRFGGNLRGFDFSNLEYHVGIGFSLKSK